MRFRNEYYFLSNMYPAPVTVNISGKVLTFTCSEAAFQATKCPEAAETFVPLNGFEAKKAGQKVRLRPGWDGMRINVMKHIIAAKFKQHPELLAKLKTVKGEIVEDNTWDDTFWGRCNGVGENNLGLILMEAREKL